MQAFEAELREQTDATAARADDRAGERARTIEILAEPGGIARADTPARVATRIDRLSRYYADVRTVSPAQVVAEDPAAIAAAGAVLERIIGTEDFVGVRYLEAGVAAARAVGRINIRDDRGRLSGYGTGSLVSPELLLTNHHVLPDAATAASSDVEFDYQDGLDGRPLASVLLRLDPDRLFLADKGLDYALVAVRATPQELAPFGFNRLVAAEGKAIVGDFVTIVQHPRGEKKQVALRENRIVDLLDRFMHYETDTEPGSSGSPVFNDQWEVVALHHASVPVPDREEMGGILNEGVRVSRLIGHVRSQPVDAARQALIDRMLDGTAVASAPVVPAIGIAPVSPAAPVLPVAPRSPVSAAPVPTAQAMAVPVPPAERLPVAAAGAPVGPQLARVTIPLEITVQAGAGDAAPASAPPPPPGLVEAVAIDPDYTARPGYDADFLGTGALCVPLPTLPDDLVPLAAVNTQATAEPRYVLAYHHFSVVMNKDRRMAFFTAVNIDGTASFRLRRERDRWVFDPRVAPEEQTGEEVYRDNPLDRGHLVRRLDPAWGPTPAAAKVANDDTFHFTNCTPQHEDFNQNQTTWAGLEDYVLENADNRDLRVSVFTGPALAEDDEPFKGIALPRQFWKVVVMVRRDGSLSATAYLLSQEHLLQGLETTEFSYGAYETFQVTVRRIEELTRLSFGALADADPLARLEATPAPRRIDRPTQLVL